VLATAASGLVTKASLTNLHFPYLHELFIGQTSAEKINDVLDLVTVLHLINVTLNTHTATEFSKSWYYTANIYYCSQMPCIVKVRIQN